MTLWALLRDRRIWLVIALIVVVAVVHWSGLSRVLTIETLRAHRGALVEWVAANRWAAALAYVVVYVAAVTISLPGASILTLSGGFLFGAALGGSLAVGAATLGATLVFLFARSLFGDSVLDRFGGQGQRLAKGLRRNAASYLLALRLAPIFPFFLINLVPAFAGVPLATYVLTTFVGVIPGTTVFALAGAGLGAVLDRGGAVTPASVLTPEILAGLLGLAALSLAAIPIRKRLAARNED